MLCGPNFHCCHSPECAPSFAQDIYTDLFSEGFCDKVFSTDIVTALGYALGDKDDSIRSSAVNFFTTAIAQGVHCHLYGIIILKYLQRTFETGYLT